MMWRELLVSGGGVALVRLAGMGAGFALTIVLARMLGPESFGTYGYVLYLLSIAAIPVSNGWAALLLRAASRAQADGDWAEPSGLIRWGGMGAAAIAALAFIFGLALDYSLLNGALGLDLLLIFCSVLFFDQLSALRLAALRGVGRPIWGQVPEMLLRPGAILLIFLGLAAWAGGPHRDLAFGAHLATSAGVALIGWTIFRWLAPSALLRAKPASTPVAWSRSAGILAIGSGLVVLNGQADFMMLGVLGEADQVGHYRVAMQVALVSGFGYTALNMIAMQRFSTLAHGQDYEALQESATLMARIAFITTLPMPAIFWFGGADILGFVFGEPYRDALPPLLWLLGLQVLNAFFGLARTMVVAGDDELRLLPMTAASVVFNIVGCAILIPLLGMVGAAIATLLAQGAWNLLLWLHVYRQFSIDTSILGLINRSA